MQTIVIILYPERLEYPNADLRYMIAERMERYTDGKIKSDGYAYLEQDQMAIYLQAEDAKKDYLHIVELFAKELFCENDLSKSAEIYISEQALAELTACEKVYPQIV